MSGIANQKPLFSALERSRIERVISDELDQG
jgi:hypothetical protein